MIRALASVAFVAALSAVVGCSSESPGASTQSSGASTTSGEGGAHSTSSAGGAGGVAPCGEDTSDPDEVLDVPNSPDPTGGVFTLEQALEGLPEGPGPLRAIIETEKGVLTCVLRDDKTPNSVANFVGLARGTRPWFDRAVGVQHWVKRRFYDGLTWHRVVPDFVAQGGDPNGNGSGGPGYDIPDELTDLTHVAGAMAWANSGPNTQGSQYYVTDGAQHFLDGTYTVFGLCTPADVIAALTHVPADMTTMVPVTPIHMTTVKITRCAEK